MPADEAEGSPQVLMESLEAFSYGANRDPLNLYVHTEAKLIPQLMFAPCNTAAATSQAQGGIAFTVDPPLPEAWSNCQREHLNYAASAIVMAVSQMQGKFRLYV